MSYRFFSNMVSFIYNVQNSVKILRCHTVNLKTNVNPKAAYGREGVTVNKFQWSLDVSVVL